MYEECNLFDRLKTCPACGDTLPATTEYFYANKQVSGGLRGKCKDCYNGAIREHYWRTHEQQLERGRKYREENPEKAREQSRRYRQENPEKRAETQRRYYEQNREAIAEYNRWYRETYPDKRFETQRNYRENNSEKIAEYDRRYEQENAEQIAARRAEYRRQNSERRAAWNAQYRRENKDIINQGTARRRSLKLAVTVGKVCYRTLLEQYGMVCHICGGDIESRADLHMDHVVPVSRGGAHSMDNIKPSHATCNLRKNARLMEELGCELSRNTTS